MPGCGAASARDLPIIHTWLAAQIGRATKRRRKPRATTDKPLSTYDNLSHLY